MILKGIIFDFDGTLVNTLPVCYKAFRNVFMHYTGSEYADEEIAAMFGPTEEGVLKKLIPDKWEESFEMFLTEYDKGHEEEAKPFEGIREALGLLKERGTALAIVSGKGASSMDISLKHTGLKVYFDTVVTGSAEKAEKPAHIQSVLSKWGFEPCEVGYVGDTAYDVKASREAGVKALSAGWAATADPDEMAAMEPDALFIEITDFIAWLKLHTEPAKGK